jgi:hypothetical protein
MTPLKWWGTRRATGAGAARSVVSVVMQEAVVVEVRVDDAPVMQIRRLSGMVGA